MSDWDVIIVGGGPAGATTAALLLRYRPDARVLILEKDAFPRFHVGETLVAEINRILGEMGIYEEVNEAGFVRKYGATFRWGSDEAVWDLTFGELESLRPAEERFGPFQTGYTWHVDRARYDDMLLKHAEKLGATVRHKVEVVDLPKDASGRVTGVVLSNGEAMSCRWVVDATGQAGLLGSARDREMDPHLRNVAVWGYYEGAKLNPKWCGEPGHSRAFICAHSYGWTWLFPISDGMVSVGVVTSAAGYKESGGQGLEAFFNQALASSDELSEILAPATLVPYQPGDALLNRIADFSYLSRTIHQPGLVRVGDAAGFIDPILSVGCFNGQTGGRYLAYSLATLLDPANKLDEALVLDSYADQMTDIIRAFRELTYFFYRFNERPDAWWQHARDLVQHAGLPSRTTDKQAFAIFASGFAARRSVFREPTQVFDEPFFFDAFRRLVDRDGPVEVPEVNLDGMDVVRLLAPATLSDAVVPLDGQGKVVPALRVEFTPGDAWDGNRLIRRLLVPPSMRPLFALVDGKASVEQLGDKLFLHLGVGAEHRKAVRRYVRQVLGELAGRGLAEKVPRAATAHEAHA